MPIPLAAAAAIGSLIGLAITIGKIGTDYASDESGFERLRGDIKTAARQNNYVTASHVREEYFFLHRDDWENPSVPVLTASGYTNAAMQAMRVFVRPMGKNSLCRCVSFQPDDGFFSNEWRVITWGRQKTGGLSKKLYTTDTAGCAALFKEKYINGELAMQSSPRQRLESHAFT